MGQPDWERSAAIDRYVNQLRHEVGEMREQLAAMTKERDYLKNNAVREALAAYAHEAWSGWMRYLFSQSHMSGATAPYSAVIPPALVERWTRQMTTPYADLLEGEKASDRKEADEILAAISKATTAPTGAGA